MDTNNWRAAQGQVQMSGQVIGGDAVPPGGMEGGDWRTQLQQESRQRIVNKIMESLKRHLPFSGQEGLFLLKKIAVRFEEKIYTAATSQSDYLRRISLKMLTMETKSQNPMANSLQSNAPATSQNPQDPAQGQDQMSGQVIGGDAVPPGGMEGGDWRTQLQQESRQRNVNKIMETLKRHLPFSGQEGLQELKKIAVRFEEKIYIAATSQSDYLRRISLKMLTMETKSQNPMANSLQSNAAATSQNPQDPAQGQVQKSGQVIGGDAVPPEGMEGGDWRTQLQQESRQRNVNKIMEALKIHLPFSGQEGLQELKKIAVRFEEKIYTAATSQSDYLRKISLKMLTMETKSQNPMANSLQSNAAATSQNPQDPASLDSSSQTVSANGGDWQEEIYQKIKSMHEMYYSELNEMYQRMVAKLQQHDAIPQQPKNEQLVKLRFLKLMLERLIMFLRTNKNDIQPNHEEKIVKVENQIVNILYSNRPRKPASSLQQGQLAQPHMHAMQQQQPPMSQMHSNEFSGAIDEHAGFYDGCTAE